MLEANETNQKNIDLVNANAKHKIKKGKKRWGEKPMDIQEVLEACDTNNNDATKETRKKM